MTPDSQMARSKREPDSAAPPRDRNERRRSRLRGRAALLVAAIVGLGGLVGLAGGAFPEPTPAAGAPAAAAHTDQTSAAPANRPQAFSARALALEGESWLAAGHPGRAILSFERARLIAPRSAVVIAGLARARAGANLQASEPGPLGRIAQRLSAGEWGWIFLIGLGVFAVGLVAFAWSLVHRRGLLALLLVGAGVGCLGLLAAHQVSPAPGRAVLVAADAVARIAPFDHAEQAFVAPEGTVVTVERTYGDYALIAGSDGRGWVPHDAIETIVPEGRRRS